MRIQWELCQLEGRRALPVQVGNPEPGGCWDGGTAWRMPRRQWRHRNWGCCCIDTEAGWYRRSPPGASGQTLIPHNKWTDTHRTMKNSSIGYTTRGVNFIEDWIFEIINYPTVVELCIPVNRFRNLYFSISIFVIKVLFYKKCCFSFLWHYDNSCSTQWNKRLILDIVTMGARPGSLVSKCLF